MKVSGPQLAAAVRIGVDPSVYAKNIKAGMAWCSCCREFHNASEFGHNRSRKSGRNAVCRASRRKP